MTRVVTALCITSVFALGLTAYALLGPSATDAIRPPAAPAPGPAGAAAAEPPLQAALRHARRTCSREALDDVVGRLRAALQVDDRDGATWRLLADALLERVLQRGHLLGMTIGEPVHKELPADLADDIDAGLSAAARARELGGDSASVYRIAVC
jgi:hypothetical protein